jgi:hypothetical protein
VLRSQGGVKPLALQDAVAWFDVSVGSWKQKRVWEITYPAGMGSVPSGTVVGKKESDDMGRGRGGGGRCWHPSGGPWCNP